MVSIKLNRVLLLGLIFTFLVLLVSGCATIMQGTTQQIGIQSTPTGATVKIDQKEYGNTPVVADLSRKENHIVNISLEGYEPFEGTITRSTSGWVWGNILFGGLIGLAVDAISGGLYKLNPEQIQAELQQNNTGLEIDENGIIIMVTLKPSPEWEKIGNLVLSQE